MIRIIYLCIILLAALFNSYGQGEQIQMVSLGKLNKLYKINDSVYRSEQPNSKEFHELENLGIKTIINLRRLKDDTRKAKGTNLILKHIPLRAGELSEADLKETLRIIHSSEKPLLIHCWHGSDRTGAVIAAYRMALENWEKKKAINEFMRPEFGYHRKRYPNLRKLLLELDVAKIQQELH